MVSDKPSPPTALLGLRHRHAEPHVSSGHLRNVLGGPPSAGEARKTLPSGRCTSLRQRYQGRFECTPRGGFLCSAQTSLIIFGLKTVNAGYNTGRLPCMASLRFLLVLDISVTVFTRGHFVVGVVLVVSCLFSCL